jgi:hypothetical protein
MSMVCMCAVGAVGMAGVILMFIVTPVIVATAKKLNGFSADSVDVESDSMHCDLQLYDDVDKVALADGEWRFGGRDKASE